MSAEDAADRLYRDKVILAPMVRAGTLPFRVLALRYGADTVFTEEVIDRRIVNATRTENPLLETVDYVENRGNKPPAVPFQTCALERERVVYQIGTGDPVHALRAAQHVERDVAAVDINMGCPKRFSLQGGMGAALLKRPEVAADIVGTLRRNLSLPVSTKIRLLDSPSQTVEFAKRMEKAGACALTVHVRQLEDKPASKARWEELRPVVDAVNIPVIANGDVYTRKDMDSIKALSGCSSVMLARPALLNCSIFKADGDILPLKEVIKQYLRECVRYDSIYQNAKYTVMEMINKRRHPDHLKPSIRVDLPKGSPGMPEVTAAKTLEQLAALWNVDADYYAELRRRQDRVEGLGREAAASVSAERRSIHKFDDSYFADPVAEHPKSNRNSGIASPVASSGDSLDHVGKSNGANDTENVRSYEKEHKQRANGVAASVDDERGNEVLDNGEEPHGAGDSSRRCNSEGKVGGYAISGGVAVMCVDCPVEEAGKEGNERRRVEATEEMAGVVSDGGMSPPMTTESSSKRPRKTKG